MPIVAGEKSIEKGKQIAKLLSGMSADEAQHALRYAEGLMGQYFNRLVFIYDLPGEGQDQEKS